MVPLYKTVLGLLREEQKTIHLINLIWYFGHISSYIVAQVLSIGSAASYNTGTKEELFVNGPVGVFGRIFCIFFTFFLFFLAYGIYLFRCKSFFQLTFHSCFYIFKRPVNTTTTTRSSMTRENSCMCEETLHSSLNFSFFHYLSTSCPRSSLPFLTSLLSPSTTHSPSLLISPPPGSTTDTRLREKAPIKNLGSCLSRTPLHAT